MMTIYVYEVLPGQKHAPWVEAMDGFLPPGTRVHSECAVVEGNLDAPFFDDAGRCWVIAYEDLKFISSAVEVGTIIGSALNCERLLPADEF